MRIFTWNVNGYRACAKKGFLDWLDKEQPDILCLQETRTLPEQIDAAHQIPEHYHATWNPAEKKGYSGTLTLSLKKPKSTKLGLDVEKFDCEGRLIENDFGDFIIFNVYFPNGGRDLSRVPYKLEFYSTLLNRVKALHKKKKKVLITGDWNTCHQPIDIARPKENEKNTGFLPEEREWIGHYLDENLVDTYREEFPDKGDTYTWWSQRGGARQRNVGWRLDYFLVSKNAAKKVKKNIIHDKTLGSDHCPVELVWE